MLKWIAQNKYKLMAFIMGLYLLVDVLQHKGQTRVLLPKQFPEFSAEGRYPSAKKFITGTNKNWPKGINTKEKLVELDPDIDGFECDVYFDSSKNSFNVHHDAAKSTGLSLDSLLDRYRQQKMTAGIWLDIKNLSDVNSKLALQLLIELRTKYGLQNKLLTESSRADLLTAFSDSGFFTSYYTPLFNPYQSKDTEIKSWIDSIRSVLKKSNVSALSGYYFQYPFLKQYFPNYPVLTWTANGRLSLINWLFKRKLDRDKRVLIALYAE